MKLATEAPINGGRNYDGPKVKRNVSLSKTWPYAGKPEDPNATRSRMVEGSKNAMGAGNQQERPDERRPYYGSIETQVSLET